MRVILPLLLLAAVCVPLSARAQSTEDRLRDALRQSVGQMREAQDARAQAEAGLQKADQDRAALQAQLDAARASLAEAAAKPAAKPEDLSRLQAALAASRAQAAALQQEGAKVQGAYQALADQARLQGQQNMTAQARSKADTAALQTCKSANAKLIDVAEGVLQLYRSQSFRSVLLRSYEPLLGTAKVTLENTVQDYDDKIRAQEYIPATASK